LVVIWNCVNRNLQSYLVLFYNRNLWFLNIFTFVSNISLSLRNEYIVDLLHLL
jgi:hypothetical protein